MLRIICACIFAVGLFAGATPAIANVEQAADRNLNEVEWNAEAEAESISEEIEEEEANRRVALRTSKRQNRNKVRRGYAPPTVNVTVTPSPEEEMEELEEDSISPTIENHNTINLGGLNPAQVAYPGAREVVPVEVTSRPLEGSQLAQVDSSTQVLTASETMSDGSELYLIPMVGTTAFVGRWNDHIKNNYTFGLIVEKPLSERLSIEVEGSYGKSYITYSNFLHSFNQFTVAGNGKYYLGTGMLQPYVGAGIVGTYFQNMTGGPLAPYNYNHWLGSGQLIAGGDVVVTKDVSVGVRGAYVRPLFNKPGTLHNGVFSAPGFEESAAINSSYVKLMGAVKVAL